MNFAVWKPWYEEIAAKLSLNEREDQAAAERLSALLQESSSLEELSRVFQGQTAIIFGAGPSLEHDIVALRHEGIPEKAVIVCADGASSACLRLSRFTPGAIVTDLDGDLDDIIYANRMGAMVLVHGHGDNTLKLNQYVPLLRRPLIGTTQVKPLPNVYNFGGFTDGDRAAFAAEANAADMIVLAGMDFGSRVGPYSKPGLAGVTRASWRKQVKLKIAKRLIEWLAVNGRTPIVNCTGGGEDLKGIPRVSWREAGRLLI